MKIVVLSGGIGGSRFIQGLLNAKQPDDDITVIANTADDIWLFGLRICPDLDTIMYTLGGGIEIDRGWGRADETWNAKADLEAYGIEQAWFGLGDRDIATHLVRTLRLKEGRTLSEATTELCARWRPGVQLVPMSDDEVETHIGIDYDGGRRMVHFQEYWIRLRAAPAVLAVEFRGINSAAPAPGVIDAILEADLVILPPSNPVVSIGPIIGIEGIRKAIMETAAPVVGVSPIIGGGAVRGMADQLLSGLGIEISAAGVAEFHGSKASGGLLDGWLVDASDAEQVPRIEALRIASRAVPLYMNDDATKSQLARDALDLALDLRRDAR